jgi:hypothetical protein
MKTFNNLIVFISNIRNDKAFFKGLLMNFQMLNMNEMMEKLLLAYINAI